MPEDQGPPPRRPRAGDLSGVLADLHGIRGRLERLEDLPARLEALEGLPDDVRALRDRVQDLRDVVQDLNGAVQNLTEGVTPIGDGDEAADGETDDGDGSAKRTPRPSPIWWPAQPDEAYATLIVALREWLRDVVAVRYIADARKLTPCWERHPLAVDLLTAAWTTWQVSYFAEGADPHAAADWQSRIRIEAFGLVFEELKSCREEHDPPVPPLDATDRRDRDLLESFEPIADRVQT